MAQGTETTGKAERGNGAGASASSPRPSLRQVWQVPAMIGAGVLFVGGVAAVIMTTPEPVASPQFDRVKELIERHEYEPAIEALNTKLLPFAERGSFTPDQTRDFHLYMARALYLGQKAKNISVSENNQNIIEEYAAAEKANASLTPQDIFALAETLIAEGSVGEGLERAMKLPESDRGRRVGLFRAVIEKTMHGDRAERDRALDLLGTLLADAELDINDRVWATTRQARMLAESGYTEDAVAKLLRAMPRLSAAEPAAMGELYLMLGRCYLKLDDIGEAAKQFVRAESLISDTLPQWAETQLALARIDEGGQRTEEAKNRYESVVKRFADTPAYLPAMLGLAETLAALQETEASVASYSTVVDALVSAGSAGGHAVSSIDDSVSASRVNASLMSRHKDAYTAGQTELALRYADLAERLFPEDQTPAEVLLALAETHRKLAQELLTPGVPASSASSRTNAAEPSEHELETSDAAPVPHAQPVEAASGNSEHHVAAGADAPVTHSEPDHDAHSSAAGGEHAGEPGADTQAADTHGAGHSAGAGSTPTEMTGSVAKDPSRQAQKHLIYAGRYFRRHANKAILSDTAAYADSLWAAADAFDRSGNQEDSIAAFQDYVSAFAGDARQPEARFRLAQAYQARGDLEQAAKLYRELIEQRGEAARGAGAGMFADASYVPLAQTILLDNDPANDAQAESLLNEVAGGTLGGTDGANFRGALIELGRYYYQARNFERGIERLEELAERFPGDPQIEATRYKLADSYRLSADQIEERLAQAMPDQERRTLETRRVERLTRAEKLFEQVRDSLEGRPAGRRSDLEQLELRNSYFYLGDCAFDLKAYDRAIRHYDAARDRYAKDPASLVAMVQIVSAYLEQGDIKRAIAANERAKRFFEGLPESAWDDPSLPMTRRDWERWLDATSRLAEIDQSASGAVRAGAEDGAASPGGRP